MTDTTTPPSTRPGDLRHGRHPVRQRRAAPRLRVRARRGRRVRPRRTGTWRAGPLPRRHRRPLVEERAGGRGAAGTSTRELRGSPRRPLRRPRRTARAVARRLHPHERRSATPPGGRAALARLRGGRRPLPRRVRRPLLRRLRGLLRAGRARRRALPGARHRARGRRRAQLVLPPLALPRRPRRTHHVRRAGDHAGAVPRRGARVPPARAARHQRLALGPAGAWVGHPRARRSRPGRVRLVRCADELPQRRRLRRARQRRVRRVVDRSRTPRPCHRQGHPALPRRVLAGVPARPPARRCRRRSTSTRTSRSTGRSCPSRAAR